MKEKPFRIELKKPCRQNWDAMPRVNGGLYCSQCAKVVTDFTSLSDEELIRFLNRKKQGETCGKFYQHQLDKVYFIQTARPQRSYHSLKLLLAGLLTLPFSSEAQIPEVQKTNFVKAGQQKPGAKTQAHSRVIKGKVIDRTSRAGIYATIKLYADNSDKKLLSTVFSDSSGHYKLLLPDTSPGQFFRIVYFSENYQERSVVVDRDKAPAYLPVSLLFLATVEVVTNDPDYGPGRTMGGEPYKNTQLESLGGILPHYFMVKVPFHKRVWARLKVVFRKTFRRSN